MNDRTNESFQYYSHENPSPADNLTLLRLAVVADSNRKRFGNGRIGWKQAGVLAGGAVMLMACQAAAATQSPENQVGATATPDAAITSTSTAVVLENDNLEDVFTLTPSAPPTIIDQESIVGMVESRVRNPDYLSAIGGEIGEGEESARLSPLARTTLDAYAFVPVLGPEGQTGYVEKSNYHLVPMAEISSEDGDKLLLTTDLNESWYVYKSSDGKIVRYMPKQVSCKGECVIAVSYNENAPGITQIFDFDPETGEILGVAQAFYTSDEDDVKFGEFEEDKWDTEVSGANAIVIGISNGVQGLTYDLDTDSIVFQIDNGTTNTMSEPVPLDQFKNSSDLGFYVDSEDGVYVWTDTGFVKATENMTPDGAQRFGAGDKNFVRKDGVMTWIDSFEEKNGNMTIQIGGKKYVWEAGGWVDEVVKFDANTWDTMDQTAKDEALVNFPETSPEGFTRDKYGTANDAMIKYLAEDGSIGSVFDVTTGTFLTPEMAGKIDFATITQENSKGEAITNIIFGEEEWDNNIQYIAKNAKWEIGDRNEANSQFAFDPELDNFLEQFKGMPGYIESKSWSVKCLPMSFSNSTDFFILYFEKRGNKTLMIFKNTKGEFEAVFSELNIRELMDDKTDDPVMDTLHP